MFGGTFDPVHVGHVAKAREGIRRLGLERVLLTVAGDPWMKRESGLGVTAAVHRLNMVRLAASGNPGIEADGREILRQGPSHTADTLEDLAADNPGVDLFLLVGADCLPSFPQWSRPDRILELATVAVFTRSESGVDLAPLDLIRPGAGASARVLAGEETSVSSSAIRRALAAGRVPCGWLDDEVARYIEREGLYRR